MLFSCGQVDASYQGQNKSDHASHPHFESTPQDDNPPVPQAPDVHDQRHEEVLVTSHDRHDVTVLHDQQPNVRCMKGLRRICHDLSRRHRLPLTLPLRPSTSPKLYVQYLPNFTGGQVGDWGS